MKRKPIVSLALFFLLLLNALPARAQQLASIGQLRDQIQNLEMVGRREHLSAEVRAMNREFIAERRVKLRTLLEKRLTSMSEYLLTAGASLSVAETKAVEDSIRSLNAELNNLKELTGRDEDPEEPSDESPRDKAPATLPVAAAAPAAAVAPAAVAAAAPAPLQSENREIRSVPAPMPAPAVNIVRQPTAEIINSDDARALIEAAFRAGAFKAPDGTVLQNPGLGDDFHCLIHILRWSDPSAPNDNTQEASQEVTAQNWYVYNNGNAKGVRTDRIWSQEDFATANRLYGVKKVWLLYVHLNKDPGANYTAYYSFNIAKKTAANVANLLALAKIFSGVGGQAADAAPRNFWGGSAVETHYVPSDVTVTASITRDPAAGPLVAVDKPKKYDNEGLYWWDVSVGVPISRINELEFDTTNNTVTSKEVDKQNIFALFNLYLPPKDIKGTGYSWIPHFVGGVAIAKQPLKKFMFGAGFGPHFANFYAGVLFTEVKKPATLTEGSTATPEQLNADIRKSFKPQFTFGINIPVRAVLATMDKSK